MSIPGGLGPIKDFINTRDLEKGTDGLEADDGLRGFLADLGWGRVRIASGDRQRAIEVREALRALALANNGAAPATEALRVLDRAARRSQVGLHFRPEGSGLQSSATGVDAALGQMLASVHDAMHDGTWGRLKACRDADCAWAFYDLSKNHSATWCSMEVCGNRNKARRFRQKGRE
jgi:predicted RNA-binding Zn ribbon-like protein